MEPLNAAPNYGITSTIITPQHSNRIPPHWKGINLSDFTLSNKVLTFRSGYHYAGGVGHQLKAYIQDRLGAFELVFVRIKPDTCRGNGEFLSHLNVVDLTNIPHLSTKLRSII